MATGTTTLDFGSGKTDTQVFVAAPSISGSNLVEAWIIPSNTSNNTVDNHWVEDLKIIAGEAVNASGFTIYGKCNTGLAYGIYKVGWVFA
jgi:hypothetical protein